MTATIYRQLNRREEARFRRWARQHHAAGEPINPLWHPVVRDEARRIDAEQRP